MRKKQDTKPAKTKQYELYILYAFLILSVVGYIMLNNVLLGALALVLLVITIAVEFKYSVKEEGMRKSIYDILIAIVAIAILWMILIVVLGTTAPINVVASCSMLPALHRGDMVALHGISNMTSFLNSHDIQIVNVSPKEMNYTLANMGSEFLAYFAYDPSNKSAISETFSSKQFPVALYNTRCIDTYESEGLYRDIRSCMVDSQRGNLIKYNYSIENISISGGNELYIVQTSDITIANTSISENYSNPIIVYKTTSNDSFSGDIIHRLFAAIRSGNEYYLLTKGDNNGGLDIQFVNYPVSQNAVVGYVIADVPAVGYIRLIISGMLATPAGCNSTILR